MNRPTISELVPHYVSFGITVKNAVQYIVQFRLSSRNARGKGHRAARHMAEWRASK